MGILKEFEKFISRGNVIDLAVGIVIGGAFTTIVNSLVKDILMPLMGMITGKVDFSQKVWILQQADPTNNISEVALSYGNVVQSCIQFLIVAFAVFMLVKGINKFREKAEVLESKVSSIIPGTDKAKDAEEETPAPAPPTEVVADDQQTVEILKEILEELRSKK